MIEKNLKYLFFALLCIIAKGMTVFCQSDTTIRIAEVVIESQRINRYSQGIRSVKVDSLTKEIYSGQTMTDLLSGLNVAFVKNYGPGTLATLSSRGMGASQTSIIWNGINLQNGMNGTVDPSLFPVGMVDEIFFISGGVSALYGSGNIGGALFLNTKNDWNQGFVASVRLGVGSFQNYNLSGKVSFSDAKLSFSTKAIFNSAENNFYYKNTTLSDGSRVRQTNNFLNNFNLQSGLSWKISGRDIIHVNACIYDNYRQIPGTMFVTNSNAKQIDKGFRGVAEYISEFKHATLFLRSAYNHERLIFSDPNASIYSNSLTQHWLNEVEFRFRYRRTHSFESVISNNYYKAVSKDLSEINPNQNRISGLFSYHYNSRSQRFGINAGLRLEYLWGIKAPLMPILSLHYKVIPQITINGGISRNFRFPTLNDLYWNPGGNPNLNFESGWNFDLGFHYSHCSSNKKFRQDLGINGYFIYLKDRILWVPKGSFWTPENIPLSFSRGLEFRHQLNFQVKNVLLSVSYSYNFTRATNESLLTAGDESYRKQMIYVPMHMGNLNLSISWRGYKIGLLNNYTGERFTASDNSAFMPSFWLSNLYLMKGFKMKNFEFGINLNINNLFNQSYQVMLWRAMPGINFNCGISIQFKHKIK
jgi:iron complex outermembrane receptor protein